MGVGSSDDLVGATKSSGSGDGCLVSSPQSASDFKIVLGLFGLLSVLYNEMR